MLFTSPEANLPLNDLGFTNNVLKSLNGKKIYHRSLGDRNPVPGPLVKQLQGNEIWNLALKVLGATGHCRVTRALGSSICFLQQQALQLLDHGTQRMKGSLKGPLGTWLPRRGYPTPLPCRALPSVPGHRQLGTAHGH